MEASVGNWSGKEADAVDVVADKSVGTRVVVFTFGTGEFARGCLDTQLLFLQCVGLVVNRTSPRINNGVMEEDLKIQFAFPCRG